MKYKIEIEIDVDPKAVELEFWESSLVVENEQNPLKAKYKSYIECEEEYLRFLKEIYIDQPQSFLDTPGHAVTNSNITKL
mgnify:CR=1 FL=1|tara:strand:- start:360 stop:599 length:240 start_codon:yes stop_codon:yes gene_type:complete